MSVGAALLALIPKIVNITVDIVKSVKDGIDDKRWKTLGPEIQSLIEKAISGDDFSHDELMKYIPQEFELRLIQLRKDKERLEQGLAIVGD